jgi:hypothetical protein
MSKSRRGAIGSSESFSRRSARTKRRKALVLLSAAEGEVSLQSLPICCGRSTIAPRAAKYSGPNRGVRLRPGDAVPGRLPGRDLPGTVPALDRDGIPQRSHGRPRYASYDLIYARLGGITVITAPETGFGLTLDRFVYTANLMLPVDPVRSVPVVTARFTVHGTQDPPLRLPFPTGQVYDLVLRDERAMPSTAGPRAECLLRRSTRRLAELARRTTRLLCRWPARTTSRSRKGNTPPKPGSHRAAEGVFRRGAVRDPARLLN